MQEGKGLGVYNVVIIGAGTAGLVVAAGTAGLGGRVALVERNKICLLYTSPSPRDLSTSRMPSSA